MEEKNEYCFNINKIFYSLFNNRNNINKFVKNKKFKVSKIYNKNNLIFILVSRKREMMSKMKVVEKKLVSN